MKRIKALMLGVAGSTLIATSALAADIPVVVAPTPPPPPPAPVFDWSGPYIGASAHVSWCGGGVICIPPTVYGGALVAGYNAQFGSFVVGAEGQVSATWGFGPFFIAEANARAGYALDRVLLYTQAGVGYMFGGGGAIYTVGAGVEFAVNDSISLFTEVAPYRFFGGSPTFWRASGGVNFHFGN